MNEFWKYATNFTPSEFACPCGCDKKPDMDMKLLFVLQTVRNYVGKPMIIPKGGGYRCVKYNATVKGAVKGSYHTKKKACDFYINGYTNSQRNREALCKFIRTLPSVKYVYHNLNGSYPNMGYSIHIEVY